MVTQGNLYTIGKCHFPKKTELHGQEVQYSRKEIAVLNEKFICIYGFEFHSLLQAPIVDNLVVKIIFNISGE